MKKLLLIAAMAAVALGASAGYTIQKVWTLSAPTFFSVTNDARQGFGMDGKFYIHNKTEQVVYEIGQNGLTGVTFEGATNTAISRDEAGNIILSNAGFGSTAWGETSIKVIKTSDGSVTTHPIPADCGLLGRCDFFGFCKGNMLEDGVLYLTGGTPDNSIFTDGIVIIPVEDGEVNGDNCYAASCTGLTATNTSTVIHYYKDINGNDALLFAYRSGAPGKITVDAQNSTPSEIKFIRHGLTLPNKGACNGVFPIIWDGKELYLYPTLPNYQDGFAIAEDGAETPLIEVPSSVTANPNGIQCNWLNAEVDEEGVTIYQFVPGGQISVYRLTKTTDYTVASNILGNWTIDPANNMTLGEDGLYTLTVEDVEIPANYLIEYKVTSNGTWWPADFNAEYLINEAGIYTLVFTFDPKTGNVSLVATKTGSITPVEHTYTVAGTQNLFGSNWNPADTTNDMMKGEDGIYTWTKDNVVFEEAANIQFKVVQDHSWDYAWPADNYSSDLEVGTYNIVITFNAETKVVTFTATPAGMRGDVNNDQKVDITDATTLINYLLYGDATGINMTNANCDWQNDVDISDATTLINFLLYGTW